MAGVNHRIGVKRGNVGVHAPADGFTTPVPQFKKDIAALMRLTDFDLPPLRVVRPPRWCRFSTASETRQENNLGPLSWRITIFGDI